MTCHEIVTMTPTVSASDTAFATTPEGVREAPARPDHVRVETGHQRAGACAVENAMGIVWTWSYTAVRSQIRPSPTREAASGWRSMTASAMARPASRR